MTAKGASAATASATWYVFNYYFTQCDPGTGGCSLWNITLQTYGTYDGSNVYQWGVWCSPGGTGPDNNCTWRGYFFNGGTYVSGWPNKAMQFGDDSKQVLSEFGGSVTTESGQRVWVDVYGTWFDYSTWT